MTDDPSVTSEIAIQGRSSERGLTQSLGLERDKYVIVPD